MFLFGLDDPTLAERGLHHQWSQFRKLVAYSFDTSYQTQDGVSDDAGLPSSTAEITLPDAWHAWREIVVLRDWKVLCHSRGRPDRSHTNAVLHRDYSRGYYRC